MFQVEINAKAQAASEQARLISQGWTEANARSYAGKLETDLVAEGNRWITETVGLD
jgi:hypothetical protein